MHAAVLGLALVDGSQRCLLLATSVWIGLVDVRNWDQVWKGLNSVYDI